MQRLSLDTANTYPSPITTVVIQHGSPFTLSKFPSIAIIPLHIPEGFELKVAGRGTSQTIAWDRGSIALTDGRFQFEAFGTGKLTCMVWGTFRKESDRKESE